MLSERKKKILKAVVDEYIQTATPVSSKAIQTEHFDNISSATIRNELKTLEDMGYLLQPHTSSGRIPSNIAYEFCAQVLLEEGDKSMQEIESLHEYFKKDFQGLEQILDTCVKAISETTNYTSIAKMTNSERFKTLKLVGLSEDSAILVLISEDGKVQNSTINGYNLENQDMVASAEKILNEAFAGKDVASLLQAKEQVIKQFIAYETLIEKVFEALKNSRKKRDSLLLSGESNIFQHKEFTDIQHVKDFVEIISEKDKLKDVLDKQGQFDINITIGNSENGLSEDCAVVSASICVSGKQVARCGVIGPTRMDYSKVVAVLSNLGSIIEEVASENKTNNTNKTKNIQLEQESNNE
ncbi:MAG: heat-inducible transcriptional repressor HrcA [Bacillota bacterium]